MEFLIDPEVPAISPGDVSYYLYFLLLGLAFYAVHKLKGLISRYKNRVRIFFLILAVLQRVTVNSWYLIIGEYSLAYSLPLQICRLVVLVVIIQFFARKESLNQVIFYIGLFAYGAFFYPVGIHPITHMAGWSFFLLHSINILFPFAMYYAVGFMPSFKGLLQAYAIFVVYFSVAYFVNQIAGGNYFYLVERPFLHDLNEMVYIIINLAGTFLGFLVVWFIIQCIIKLREKFMLNLK
ncbi:TIGR02206 family membrane protein [Salinicoccus albus]|uniref:YwaF family protein n=1 Tax=Salinicoccus albus TaxID=418756 RepID=UPI0003669F87|nr:TIGR02206 family membrane protein [Salinicoccus albus]